ncbi:unnamed protein product [Ectocarpus sp. 6 AP-2014]
MSGSTTARREVSEWLKAQTVEAGDRGVGRIEIDHVKEEERRIVLKEASGGQVFSITYQKEYPNSADEYLRFLQKKSAKKGKGALGATPSSAALGQEGPRADASQGGGGGCSDGGGDGSAGDGGDDEFGEEGEEEEEEDGNESDYMTTKTRWWGEGGGQRLRRRDRPGSTSTTRNGTGSKEKALREEMAANKEREAKENADKKGVKPKKVENIFTSKASSAVLTQDLLDIQRLEQELGMEVEAVDDNIFHWKVKINRVSDTSPLREDLEKLRQTYAYGYVEMELTFTMDLYPFYPPLVKLVRPRFQGFMMGRITSLEMLQLSKWSSVRGMKGVLQGIRTALETWGRLDLGSELNDVIVHPEGSYTELEHLLMRLGLVTEIRPHASMQCDEDALLQGQEVGGGGAEMEMDEAGDGSSRQHWAPEDDDQEGEGSSVERKRKRNGESSTATSLVDPENGNEEASNGQGAGGAGLAGAPSQAKKGASDDSGGGSSGSASFAGWATSPGTGGTGGGLGGAPNATAAVLAKVTAAAAASTGGLAGGEGGGSKQGSNSSRQYWAAGTGYGHSGAAGEKWDVDAYLAAQREQDRLKEDLLQEIAYLMRPDERHAFPEFAALKRKSALPTPPPPPPPPPAGGSNPEEELEEEEGDGAGAVVAGKGKARGQVGRGEEAAGVSASPAEANGIGPGDGGGGGGGGGPAKERIDPSGRKRKKLTFAMEEYRVDSVNSSLRVLEESCLVPFLQQLLENDSLLDVDRHAALYTSVFKLVRCIASWRSLHPLLGPMKGQKPRRSLYRLLSKLGDRAKVYQSTTSKGRVGKGGDNAKAKAKGTDLKTKPTAGGPPVPASQDSSSSSSQSGKTTGFGLALGVSSKKAAGADEAAAGKGGVGDDDDDGALTDLLLAAVQDVEDVVDASFVEELENASITRPMETRGNGKGKGGPATRSSTAATAAGIGGSAAPARGRGSKGSSVRRGGRRGSGAPSPAGNGSGEGEGEGEEEGEGEDEWHRYRGTMAPLQYVEVEDLVGFCFKAESSKTANRGNPQRVKRLGQEHADLSQSLPLSLSSSVFVRTHEDQMDWMQVMISGPDDTPYSGGLFAFDIFFPHNYPQTPPKVKLMTTGGGTHRFNPNLYADGKVCLSLLGTWDGDRGESWNAQTSTLLQVLVSIQSLIFVPQPFFNEPGYERQLGTELGKTQSWDYNAKQREGTLKLAMLQMLQMPRAGFESVVRGHFYLRRKYLEGLVAQYISEATARQGSGQHLKRLQALATQLQEKFATLQPTTAS